MEINPASLDVRPEISTVFMGDGTLLTSVTWRQPEYDWLPVFTVHWRRIDCDASGTNDTCQLSLEEHIALISVRGNQVRLLLSLLIYFELQLYHLKC